MEIRVDSLSSAERFKTWDQLADLAATQLRKKHQINLVKSESKEDQEDKIDFIDEDTGYLWQIHARNDRWDFLYDLFEPYYGMSKFLPYEEVPTKGANAVLKWAAKNKRTIYGRDHVAKCHLFGCITPDQKTVKVVSAKKTREVIRHMMQEWEASKYRLPFFSDKYTYPGIAGAIKSCEFRYHTDRGSSKRPKVLAFLVDECFGDDIANYGI